MGKEKELEITPAAVFEETLKVVHIVKRLEEEGEREISDKNRLEMLKLQKSRVQTAEEEEEMEKEELRLKRRLRFPAREIIDVPADKIDMVRRNYELEKDEAVRIMEEKYKRLNELTNYMREMNTVLNDIIELEDKKAIAAFIEYILDGKVEKNPGRERGLMLYLQNPTRFSNGHSLRVVKQKLERLTYRVEKIDINNPVIEELNER